MGIGTNKGHSTGCHQVDPATTPKFIETFSICREFFADHFDNNFFQNKFCFREDKGQIRKVHFFKKEKRNLRFYRKSGESPTFFTWISKLITYSDSS